ncbi:MAG: SlyX family protein [Myxococcota bacterium]|nr:SlyX family protein [Myxococcota bacterium]
MSDEATTIGALEARIIELEIRSEERREELETLQGFVQGYEQRIRSLERELAALRTMAESPVEPLPPASEDIPPHY